MKKKNTSLYLVALLAVALLIGVGYAALSATLNINGRTTIEKASWDVHFGNISANTADVKFYASTDSAMSSPISATSLGSTNTLKYSIDLQMDGQTHDVVFDIVNAGTIDAKISSLPSWFNSGDITSNLYVDSISAGNLFAKLTAGSCKYSDGTYINTGDVITAGDSKSVTCSHRMKTASELTNSDLEYWNSTSFSSYSTLTGTFNINIGFVQAD